MRDQPVSVPKNALGGEPTQLEPPVEVLVWLLLPRVGWKQIPAKATAYTRLAGRVSYTDEHGRSDDVWVWASAIQRR